MKRLILIALVIFMAGCATQKKKENRARNFYLDNKDKLAELSATIFPVKDEFRKGEQVALKPDTIFREGKVSFVYVDCPDGSKVKTQSGRRDTIEVYIPILQTDTIIRGDEATIQHLKNEYAKANIEKMKVEMLLSQEKEESKQRLYWIIGLSLGYVLYGLYKAFRSRLKL